MSRPLPPLATLTLALGAGVALGLRYAPGTAAAGLVAVALLPLLAVRSRAVLPAVAAAAGWALANATVRAGMDDCRARLPDGSAVVVQGAFEALPWPDAAAPFQVTELRLGGRSLGCSGTFRATAGRGLRQPPAGLELGARATWRAQPPGNRWRRRPERTGALYLDSLVTRQPGSQAPRVRPLLRARARAQALLRSVFGRRAALAESLVLAQQAGLDADTRDRFAAAGLSHLLAISGLHVGLVAATVLLLARACRLPARPASLAAAATTAAYVLFIGAPVAALRACLQLAVVLAARLLQRPADSRALLSACALALLLLSPFALLDAGFQLSFAGVLGILVLRPRLLPWLARLRPRWLRESVATSIAATLATAPIAAAHFGRVAPVGVLANLAAVPLAGLAVPALALSLLAGAAAPAAGRFLAGGAGLLLDALDTVARAAAAIPGGHALVPADHALAWVLAAGAAAAVAAAAPGPATPAGGASPAASPGLAPGQGRGPRAPAGARRRSRWLAAGTAATLLLLWPLALRLAGAGRLEIWVIDVGQGDAIALRSPAGRWLLVDAGPRDEHFDAGRARVVPFLLRHGAHRLEALILTHPDADHIGGAAAVLGALPVREVIEPAVPAGKPLYLQTIRAGRARAARWLAARAGGELVVDGLVLSFLAPGADALDGRQADNELSVVFSLRYGAFRALFMGDAPTDVEEALVRDTRLAAGALRAHVLKLGHHGSATSTGEAFLDAVAPRAALVSVGRRNRFGHPAPEVLRRLARHGVRAFRTDLQGTLEVVAGPDGVWRVETAR